MKGCLSTIIVIAALAMLTLIGGTCYLGNEVRQFVQRMDKGFSEARETDSEFPFDPAPGGLVDGGRIDAYLAIRKAVCSPTIAGFDKLSEWAEDEDFGITDSWEWSSQVREIIEQIPKLLAAQLREHQMGYTEFQWVTEVIHGTLAAADRAGDNQQATEIVAAFEDYFRSDKSSVQSEVNGRDFDYRAIREHLAEKYQEFQPENLTRILARSAKIQDPVAQLMLDVLVLQVEKESTTATSTLESTTIPQGPADSGSGK